MKNLVFTELVGGVSFQMMEDRKVVIVSDGGIFLVTTKDHCKEYPELKFDPVSDDAIIDYKLDHRVLRSLSTNFS